MLVDEREKGCPQLTDSGNVIVVAGLHVLLFLGLWWYTSAHADDKQETVIPLDLTVVVNENLNGNENEPPPTRIDPPPTPKVEPHPPPPPPPPPVVERTPDAVEVVEKPPEKPKPPKVEPPKPPKKTPEQLRKEREARLKAMRERAKPVKSQPRPAQPVTPPATRPTLDLSHLNLASGNGRTARKTLSNAEIMRMLNGGYRPGSENQIATGELQYGLSLIKNAFYEKWTDRPAWTAELRKIHLEVSFGPGGRVTGWRLTQSSGDSAADATVRRAASMVHTIPGLSPRFLKAYPSVTVEFEVKPN